MSARSVDHGGAVTSVGASSAGAGSVSADAEVFSAGANARGAIVRLLEITNRSSAGLNVVNIQSGGQNVGARVMPGHAQLYRDIHVPAGQNFELHKTGTVTFDYSMSYDLL